MVAQIRARARLKGCASLLSQDYGRLAAGHCLVGVAAQPEGQRRVDAATHPRIVSAVERSMGTVPLRLIAPQSLLQVWLGRGELTAKH
jgi:hypothetical protein